MDKLSREIRALRAEEIECRVQQCTSSGVILILYKDARCDMTVLDETFTPFGWQRKHELIGGKEFCAVSIKSEGGEWISKQDCGTESMSAKDKGVTSDAFKRACSNWGIGREIYTKIFIFVPVKTKAVGNKYEMEDKYAKFTVSKIETDNKAKKILHLEISDKNNKKVFTWDNDKPPVYAEPEGTTSEADAPDQPPTASSEPDDPEKQKGALTEKQIKRFYALRGKAKIDDETLDKLLKSKFGKESVKELTATEYNYMCDNFQSVIDKA